MKMYLELSFLALLGATTCLSAMRYDIAHFKTLLSAKDYPKIRAAIENSWPQEEPGLRLEWRDGELALIGTRFVNEWGDTYYQGVNYGKALRTFIIQEILHPVIYGKNDLKLAMAAIDELALPFDGDSSFCILGRPSHDNTTINAIKVALCKSRGIGAGKYGVLNPDDAGLQKMADDIIVYTGQYAGEANLLWGQLPLKFKLWANKCPLAVGMVFIVVCIGVINYYCVDKKRKEEEASEADGDVELDQDQIVNDQ